MVFGSWTMVLIKHGKDNCYMIYRYSRPYIRNQETTDSDTRHKILEPRTKNHELWTIVNRAIGSQSSNQSPRSQSHGPRTTCDQKSDQILVHGPGFIVKTSSPITIRTGLHTHSPKNHVPWHCDLRVIHDLIFVK